MKHSPHPGVTRAVTPGQGTMVAPWYHHPRESRPADLHAGPQPRRLLAVLGAGAALAVFLVLSDPASQPATATSLRATVAAAGAAAPDDDGPVAHFAAAPSAPAALAAHAALTPGERREARLAALDGTLAAAVAGSELAAARAHDVAIRAFAAQQAARYAGLRSTLHDLVGHAGLAGHPGDPPHAEGLAALRAAAGPGFDRLYVGLALELNRALLAELDAALADIEDGELRDAVERVRGSVGASGTP